MTRPRVRGRTVAITPATLGRAPHLAVLDVIDHALRAAAWAILAEFPALIGDPHPWRRDPPAQLAARRLLRQMKTFDRALARYRRALAPLLEPSPPSATDGDDIAF